MRTTTKKQAETLLARSGKGMLIQAKCPDESKCLELAKALADLGCYAVIDFEKKEIRAAPPDMVNRYVRAA